MRRIRVVGLCVLAVFAVGAIATSAASAEPPEFGRCLKKAKAEGAGYSDSKCNKGVSEGAQYEWSTVIPKPKFTSAIKSGTTLTLETVSKTKWTCKGETASGEVAGPKGIAGLVATLTGCESAGLKCQSDGIVGEIVTHSLSGTIGYETESGERPTWQIAESWQAAGGGEFATFSCGPAAAKVRGSLLHKITANAMKEVATEKFSASKGKQNPEEFADGERHVLEWSFAGGPYEQIGMTFTTITTYEEKVEANGVV